ncbi:MAG: hydrogenase iron-sulfur subunit [Chloroflexi bacterium]|nr:hydrogenase iron-sulfur subunit [Chloroflexota bacterium]
MVMTHEFEPKILGFLCNWCCYAGADLAGVSRYQYPPNIRIIRVMCSGRVDPKFIFRAFSNGADGVFIGGCWLDECHYVTNGNYHAVEVIKRSKKLLEQIGLNSERLRLEWVSASEGIRFAEVITNFTKQLKELGPLGVPEGKGLDQIQVDIAAAERAINNKLISYYIDPEKCTACGICARRCPEGAIIGGKDKVHIIVQEKCIACNICFQSCPARFAAIERIEADPVPAPIPEEARTVVRASKGKA